MFPQSSSSSSTASTSIISTSSQSDVTYSCGTCGYALNLSSSNRDATGIGSKYGKSIRKGVVSFVSVDESRFAQADELSCIPYFHSKRSWGLFRRRTRLLCRRCSNFIGVAYDDGAVAVAAALPLPPEGMLQASAARRGIGRSIGSRSARCSRRRTSHGLPRRVMDDEENCAGS